MPVLHSLEPPAEQSLQLAEGAGGAALGRPAGHARFVLEADERAGRTLVAMAGRDWLTVVLLPGYAPELNPVEGLWAHIKRSPANLATGPACPPACATGCVGIPAQLLKAPLIVVWDRLSTHISKTMNRSAFRPPDAQARRHG
ncbi:transposase [Streptomyces sp. NPDC007896]|uniref:transposase n=1 Tax=Streptomyces sp. NPDC007896 TaxID=3364784 RepID=UPI0036E617BB